MYVLFDHFHVNLLFHAEAHELHAHTSARYAVPSSSLCRFPDQFLALRNNSGAINAK